MKTTMQFSKSTKGTHVYTDTTKDTSVPTLYIKKSGLPENPPETIVVTVEFEGE